MLTKNFYALMRAASGRTSSKVITSSNDTVTTVFSTSGSGNWYGIFGGMCNYNNTGGSQYVVFGNGTTPATVNDYKLESPITSNITVANPSSTTTEQTDNYILWTVTFGAKASVETTISEIGLFSKAYATGGAVETLVDRTVLDTPITIPAGQSKQITYTIRFNYGDAV